MRIGVPRETAPGETRVSLLPAEVSVLIDAGHTLLVEHRAGASLSLPDEAYSSAGALMVDRVAVFGDAELLVKVEPPMVEELQLFSGGQVLMAFLDLPARPGFGSSLAEAGVTPVPLETLVDPDGGLPVLASQTALAGRLAFLYGMYHLLGPSGGPGFYAGGLAGVRSAKVAVLGGGTAGASAARAAVGARARVVVVEEDAAVAARLDESLGGLAEVLLSSETSVRAALAGADIVLGCAWVRGSVSPRLVDRSMMGMVADGGMIVDLAIRAGGCFETSRPTTFDDPVFRDEGVTHFCVPNLPAAAAHPATTLLSRSLVPWVLRAAQVGIEGMGPSGGSAVDGERTASRGMRRAFRTSSDQYTSGGSLDL